MWSWQPRETWKEWHSLIDVEGEERGRKMWSLLQWWGPLAVLWLEVTGSDWTHLQGRWAAFQSYPQESSRSLAKPWAIDVWEAFLSLSKVFPNFCGKINLRFFIIMQSNWSFPGNADWVELGGDPGICMFNEWPRWFLFWGSLETPTLGKLLSPERFKTKYRKDLK